MQTWPQCWSQPIFSFLYFQPQNLYSLYSIHYEQRPICACRQLESKSVTKAWRDGIGGEHEGVLSFEKALVYCWRACIYFMPPQIVGKGRADSVAVIREVKGERECSATETCFAQIFIVLWELCNTLTSTHPQWKYWHIGRDTCLVWFN